MRCFSAQRNLKKLFSEHKYDTEDDEFEVLNAFKVVSIGAMVLGNTYYYVMSGPLRNLNIVYDWISYFPFLWIVFAENQVDVFYWFTGLIQSFFILKKLR